MQTNPMDAESLQHEQDSLNSQVEIISLAPKLYMWRTSKNLGSIIPTPVDTLHHQFQNTNLTEGINGHNNYLGNLGSPALSRIFFEREVMPYTFFLTPFADFITEPHEQLFTNSNIPYTNITYYKTFNRLYGEERFKSYFSVNVNKRFAFGFNFDYNYGRGYYQNQANSMLKTNIFGSYVGERYTAHGIVNFYSMKMMENGGITDDLYITNPDALGQKNVRTENIPVYMSSTFNRNSHFNGSYSHRYNVGFYRDIVENIKEAVKDSIGEIITPAVNDTIEEYVPVTSFIHTFNIETAGHKYIAKDETDIPYENTFIQQNASRDTTTYIGVKNIFGIALLEGFNKYAKAGLTAYISHKYNRYTLMSLDPLKTDKYTEQEVFVGGELAKREGTLLHYKAGGEVGLAGEAVGQFRIEGDLDLNFRLGKDTITFIGKGSISNTVAPFYMRHYHSNHFWWDNDMDKEFRTRINGELSSKRFGTKLSGGFENIKNYTYFDQTARPTQAGDNILVVMAKLNQNFKLGILHWDNEVVWQKSSDEVILPLPDLTIYSNLYISAKLAKKVLSVELGADVRYFTEYLAPAYTPAVQQYHLQSSNASEQVKIGNYPIVNVYVNLHLKRTRLFAMMYHVNQGMGNSNYFLSPHYPINPSMFKFGLSWNFYD
ncbi:putative porin [Bacteroides sp. 214]|uniref:putative porin n=1 Tax=Bacteroides sp. 214 TaxID=2302935 RepID=UPI00351B9F3B